MTTWRRPEPPGADVTRLRDSDGNDWVRCRDSAYFWERLAGGVRMGPWTFDELLAIFGPLTDQTDQRAEV